MNHRQKQLSVRLLALAALIAMVPMQAAWAGKPRPPTLTLGAALPFALLGQTVTCTNGAIIGNVGKLVAYTNTTCPVSGGQPPATDTAAALADGAFLVTYDALILRSCINQPGSLGTMNLPPGVYCLDGTAHTGTLTLTGPKTGVWIFLSPGGAALTGTDFTVTMAGGGQACNVWWAPDGGTTFTTSVMQGNILAGDAIDGAITLTGGALLGRALANIAVTTTNTAVIVPPTAADCPK